MDASKISAVFGDLNSSPLFVTDNEDLCSWIRSLGISCVEFKAFTGPRPAGIVFIPTNWDALPAAAELRQRLRGTRVLWVPLDSFDSSFEAATYSIQLLLASDFEQAIRNNRSIMTKMLTTPKAMRFHGAGTDLTFTLEDEVYVNSRARLILAEGEHASIGAYFEVELGANWVELEETFHVSGEITVEGALMAHHREMPSEVRQKIPAAEELLAELRSRMPLVISIQDSRVVPGSFSDLDAALRDLTNPRYDGLLTELAFGTNTSINPHVDWSHNSQLNEGMGGIHIALGDGLTGIHIDFVCSTGELTPIT